MSQCGRLALLDLEELKSDEVEKIKSGFVALGRQNKGKLDDPANP